MRPLLVIVALPLLLSGCAALPAAGWAAIAAAAGACTAACVPVVNFERDVFDYVVEGVKDPAPQPQSTPAK